VIVEIAQRGGAGFVEPLHQARLFGECHNRRCCFVFVFET
jgi:hypothetical protein